MFIYTFDKEYQELCDALIYHKYQFTTLKHETIPSLSLYLPIYIDEIYDTQLRIVYIDSFDTNLYRILNIQPTTKNFLLYGTFELFKMSFSYPPSYPWPIEYPAYPVYVLNNNYESIHLLQSIYVPFKIVICSEEYDNYKHIVDREQILVVSELFMEKERKCGNGNIVALKNYCVHHSIEQGFKKHWMLDDNITKLYHTTRGTKYPYMYPNFFVGIERVFDNIEDDNIILISPTHYSCDDIILSQFEYGYKMTSCILIDNILLGNNHIHWRGEDDGKKNFQIDCTMKELESITIHSMIIQ